MIPNLIIQQSELKSIIITDEHPPTEYLTSIKISRKPNGTILGAAVFIPGNILAGIIGTEDYVNLRIIRNDNNIILAV